MRRPFALVFALMLAILPAMVLQLPSATHAAPAFDQVTISGRLVATPQSTDLSQPATLLLQSGSQTVLVVVTSQTQLIDANGASIALGNLRDGDKVQVTGSYNGLQLLATSVQDLSLGETIGVQVSGQLGAALSPGSSFLCLANSVVNGTSKPRVQAQIVASCPAGQLPIYLNGQTRIQNQSAGFASLTDLKAGDTLLITGVFNGVQITAALIRDTTLQAPLTLKLTGQLGTTPNPAAGFLCLANAQVSNVRRATVLPQNATLCPAGQLPIYLTSNTRVQNQRGGSASLASTKVGDNLLVLATFNGTQLIASLVRDTSLQAFSYVVVNGRLVATPQSTDLSQPVNLLLQVGSRTFLVVVTSQTQIIDSQGATLTLANLHDRDQLRVAGNYNGVQIFASTIRDLSLPAPAVQVKGQLAAAPNLTFDYLCLANTVVTGASTPRVQVQAVSACPAGQLPVYFTGGTQILRATGGGATVTDLRVGDTLQVSGLLQATQFTATVIVDANL